MASHSKNPRIGRPGKPGGKLETIIAICQKQPGGSSRHFEQSGMIPLDVAVQCWAPEEKSSSGVGYD